MAKIQDYISAIDHQGYALIPQAFSPETVNTLLAKVSYYHENRPKLDQAKIPFLNKNHQVVYNLQNRDKYFIKTMLGNKDLEDILMHLLNDTWYKQIPQDKPNYILRSMLARNGGIPPLPLHIDSFIPNEGSHAWIAQVAYVLEDQDEHNGCTIVVPGSHKKGRYASPEDLKDAIPIISKKGDIVVWDSRLWHGTTGNISGKTRWSLIATFCRWWVKQNYDITRALPEYIFNELSDSEKAILGFCSTPPLDETERVDIKCGYEIFDTINKSAQKKVSIG